MAPSIRISRKTAQALLGLVEGYNPGLTQTLRAALAPRPKKALPFVPRKKAKATKKRTKKEETSEIRAAVMNRAAGDCEACSFGFDGTALSRLDLDHFFGRVRVKQSERNCWALCRICHREKTRNDPSAAHWLERFIKHAEKHGYSEEAGMATRRLAALEMTRGAR